MKRLLAFILFSCFAIPSVAQFSSKVVDASTSEPLSSASVLLFSSGKRTGLVTNKEGSFSIASANALDSLKISMIGYRSKTIYKNELVSGFPSIIQLELAAAELETVVIKQTTALDIIKKVIAAIPSHQPGDNFQGKGFYREIIKDRQNYFSVAEAVFLAQYFPEKENFKLKLEQGRSKEDVAYTKLFEDFHPGGGPQAAAGKSFLIDQPDFLNEKKIKNFTYKIDSLVKYDDHWLYSISFDQKPGIKDALEKGKLFIDADDFALVKYECENSPLGTPYIKDLTGSDKIMAALLNIDFDRKGWKRKVGFVKVNDKWLLNHVEIENRFSYKQPKKKIDLDLTINLELLMTDLQEPLITEVTKENEWKRKNIVANLPSAFDPSFWGDNNVLSSTEEVKNIIEAIAKNNNEKPAVEKVNDWKYLNRNYFVSFQKADTITLIPVMKCWWEDEKQGAMIYNDIEGDFTMETKINLSKNSSSSEMPDKGFQQAGIIIRNKTSGKENYIFLSIGSGGSPVPKITFKKTTEGKSKTTADKIDAANGWLRIEKKSNKVTTFYKSNNEAEWKKKGEFEASWLKDPVQLGLAAFAGFSGSAPKMQPDMKADFSQMKVETL